MEQYQITFGMYLLCFVVILWLISEAFSRYASWRKDKYYAQLEREKHRAKCLEHAITTTKNFEPDEIKKEADGYWEWLNKAKPANKTGS